MLNITNNRDSHACKESYVESHPAGDLREVCPQGSSEHTLRVRPISEPTLEAGLSFLSQIPLSGSLSDWFLTEISGISFGNLVFKIAHLVVVN